jgi:hypothetical protein
LHSLGKRLGALARKARERVLREVAWHENSESELETKYSIKRVYTEGEAHAQKCFRRHFLDFEQRRSRWQDLPEEVPSTTTCWRRLRDWVSSKLDSDQRHPRWVRFAKTIFSGGCTRFRILRPDSSARGSRFLFLGKILGSRLRGFLIR